MRQSLSLSLTVLIAASGITAAANLTQAAPAGGSQPPTNKAIPPAQQFILPARGYVRPHEPINISFDVGHTTVSAARRLRDGFAATRDFANLRPATRKQVFTPTGQPLFKLYTLAGQALQPKPQPKLAARAAGSVNIAQYFPAIEKAGTYILAWRHATPLVIETLDNPGFSAAALAQIPASELSGLTAKQKSQVMLQYQPVVIHIVPLAFAQIKTGIGVIDLKFWYDVAPHTVDNFISLANQKYYDGSNFHRIIKGFMIQGGDSVSHIAGRAGTGGPGYNLAQEFNDRPFNRGVLAMARSNSPDSAGSQFFIMQAANSSLDGQYTGFGAVTSGLKVVDKLANTPVSDDNGTVKGPKPRIDSIKILPASDSLYIK